MKRFQFVLHQFVFKMKPLILIPFFILPILTSAQNKIGVLCTNFKFNHEEKEIGKDFRKTLESILANLEHPPRIIERENVPELLIMIQDERNLEVDLNKNSIKETFLSAKVDYVINGNFSKKITNEYYEFHLEFIKVSGENIFSKWVLPIIRFKENELESSSVFEDQIKKALSKIAFTEDLGIIDSDQLTEIKNRLDEKDKQISKLTELIEKDIAKEDSVFRLKNTAPDVNFSVSIIDSNLVISIKFNNNVPIKITPVLHKIWDINNTIYSTFNRAYLYPIDIFPPKSDEKVYRFTYDTLKGKKDGLPNDKQLGFRMFIIYSSLYSAEANRVELGEKEITLDYTIDPPRMKFTPAKFK